MAKVCGSETRTGPRASTIYLTKSEYYASHDEQGTLFNEWSSPVRYFTVTMVDKNELFISLKPNVRGAQKWLGKLDSRNPEIASTITSNGKGGHWL